MDALLLLLIVAGLMGGVAVGLQSPLTSMMSQQLGVLESVFFIHFGGAIVTAIPLLVLGGGNLMKWRQVPWYVLWAGSLGLIVLSAISFTVPRLGLAPTVVLIIVGQLAISALFDHFGVLGVTPRPIDPTRIVGLAILLVGTWLVIK